MHILAWVVLIGAGVLILGGLFAIDALATILTLCFTALIVWALLEVTGVI